MINSNFIKYKVTKDKLRNKTKQTINELIQALHLNFNIFNIFFHSLIHFQALFPELFYEFLFIFQIIIVIYKPKRF